MMIKIFPGTLGELSLDPLPTGLPLPIPTAVFRSGAAGAVRCSARATLPPETQPHAEIVLGHPAGKSLTASTPDPGDCPGERASAPGEHRSASRSPYPALRSRRMARPLIRTPAGVCCGGIPAQPRRGSPGSLAPPASGRRTGVSCLPPRPCSPGGPRAGDGGHIRISRLEPGLRRSPPSPGPRPGALHLRQRRRKSKRRLLFPAAGDSFLSLQQLVSFNELLLPPRCKPKSILMNPWS
ncbi:translation initiation factor IF-2-like [Motacilla alba alba]|uniref:translation initiation factor IF-2-like n=1 Tax=Motacilla alba alba TaxID=1094192 RepID=UPI0018D56F0A|nr:translation initiation factor IF-2-like [Motacilla alba alba]